jgi:hypothetical protein
MKQLKEGALSKDKKSVFARLIPAKDNVFDVAKAEKRLESKYTCVDWYVARF